MDGTFSSIKPLSWITLRIRKPWKSSSCESAFYVNWVTKASESTKSRFPAAKAPFLWLKCERNPYPKVRFMYSLDRCIFLWYVRRLRSMGDASDQTNSVFLPLLCPPAAAKPPATALRPLPLSTFSSCPSIVNIWRLLLPKSISNVSN